MGRCMYSKGIYKIIKSDENSYLVINTAKPDFKTAHTHVFNYNIAKLIVYACIKGCFPPRIKRLMYNERVIESIVRICSNKYYNKFSNQLNELREKKQKKKTTRGLP